MNTLHRLRSAPLSHYFSWGLAALGGILVLLLVFDAGFAIGERHAMKFRGPLDIDDSSFTPIGFGNFLISMPHGFSLGEHGAVGEITDISLPTMLIQTRAGATQRVYIGPDTYIKDATTTLSPQDLDDGYQVVIIGDPDDATSSELKAQLIRVLPD